MKDIKKALIIVSIVLLVSLTVFINVLIGNEVKKADFIGLDPQRIPTFQVRGEGKVYAVPDTAEIYFSVITEGETTELALDQNSKKMDQVINHLKEKGIADKDLKTASFNIRPIYVYETNPRTNTRERVLSSYEVSNRVEVKIRDLGQVSSIIDGAIRSGANNVSRLEFLIDDEKELKKQAREIAVKEAEERAKELASVLGVKIGRIISFSENDDYYYHPIFREVADMAMEGGIPEVPVEPGENEITVQVSIEYEIK